MAQYTGTLIELLQERNSVNGNPRYTVIILDDSGRATTAKTAPDSSLAYVIGNHVGRRVEYSTKVARGTLTLVDIDSLPENAFEKAAELSSLPTTETYRVVISSDDGHRTKNMNVTPGQLARIKDILVKGN